MLTLYYKPTCPFCQRVLEMAENLGVELNLADIVEDEAARAVLLEKGGKESVPFLVDDEREVSMYESGDIIDYLREHYANASAEPANKPRVHVAGGACVSCEG